MATIDLERVISYEKAGKLRVQKHPERPLFIAGYSELTVYKKLWDDLTTMCRGLVFTDDGTILGRPLRKFWNLGEAWEPEKPAPAPPDEPFTVTEKIDGSLIIAYYDPAQGSWDVASRGSFTSEHAAEARAIWHERAKPGVPGRSYCLELVVPWNRIVVNYEDERDLRLLAVIDNETGEDLPLEDIGFPVVQHYDNVVGIEELMSRYEGEDNFEGFVVRYQSGLRLKVKLPEYLRIHRLMTGINNRRIWECLSAGQSIEPFLERVPKDFAEWVDVVVTDFFAQHETILEHAHKVFKVANVEARKSVGIHDMSIARSQAAGREWRKAFAETARQYPAISALLFTLLDGGDIAPLVWKMIRPAAGEVESPYASARGAE